MRGGRRGRSGAVALDYVSRGSHAAGGGEGTDRPESPRVSGVAEAHLDWGRVDRDPARGRAHDDRQASVDRPSDRELVRSAPTPAPAVPIFALGLLLGLPAVCRALRLPWRRRRRPAPRGRPPHRTVRRRVRRLDLVRGADALRRRLPLGGIESHRRRPHRKPPNATERRGGETRRARAARTRAYPQGPRCSGHSIR